MIQFLAEQRFSSLKCLHWLCRPPNLLFSGCSGFHQSFPPCHFLIISSIILMCIFIQINYIFHCVHQLHTSVFLAKGPHDCNVASGMH